MPNIIGADRSRCAVLAAQRWRSADLGVRLPGLTSVTMGGSITACPRSDGEVTSS